jgi:hypothetical protein
MPQIIVQVKPELVQDVRARLERKPAVSDLFQLLTRLGVTLQPVFLDSDRSPPDEASFFVVEPMVTDVEEVSSRLRGSPAIAGVFLKPDASTASDTSPA